MQQPGRAESSYAGSVLNPVRLPDFPAVLSSSGDEISGLEVFEPGAGSAGTLK